MHSPNNSEDQRIIENYLDDALMPHERRELEERLLCDPQLASEIELQRRIDRSLGELFPLAPATEEHVATIVNRVSDTSPRTLRFPGRIWWVAAAAVGGVLLAWVFSQERNAEPFFKPIPLTQVYASTVAQGFEPYYECEDPERFAQVFASRQGQPLRLLAMPAGSRMLGLSYPGGLSRDTTAILCEVDGIPVMVFVDRATADHSDASEVLSESSDLNVFREERDGLVFYEVTPFDSPRALEFLVAL